MLIGGRSCTNENESAYYTKTFIYDFLVGTWTNGPEMSPGRAGLGWTSFTDEDNINWTIISGGLEKNYHWNEEWNWNGPDDYKLTQMLKENSTKWTDIVINLPFLLLELKLINFMGKAMLIGSTSSDTSRICGTDIYELEKSANGQFEWILSDLSLTYQRTTTFTVLDVPLESLTPWAGEAHILN